LFRIFFNKVHTLNLVEVNRVKKESSDKLSQNSPKDSIMDSVNQTFDEMVQDVRNLLNENSQKNQLK